MQILRTWMLKNLQTCAPACIWFEIIWNQRIFQYSLFKGLNLRHWWWSIYSLCCLAVIYVVTVCIWLHVSMYSECLSFFLRLKWNPRSILGSNKCKGCCKFYHLTSNTLIWKCFDNKCQKSWLSSKLHTSIFSSCSLLPKEKPWIVEIKCHLFLVQKRLQIYCLPTKCAFLKSNYNSLWSVYQFVFCFTFSPQYKSTSLTEK